MRSVERYSLHFDLSHLSDVPYTFNVGMSSIPMQRHSDDTRLRARAASPLLRLFPDERLTHHVDVDLPAEGIALTYVTRDRQIDGRTLPAAVHLSIHVPRAGYAAYEAKRPARSGRDDVPLSLRRLGVTREKFAEAMADEDGTVPPIPTGGIHSHQDAHDAAVALLFHHPNLINLGSGAGAAHIIEECIKKALSQDPSLVSEIETEGDAWLVTSAIPESDDVPTYKPSDRVKGALRGVLAVALKKSQDDPNLEGQHWSRQYSSTTTDEYKGTIGVGAPPLRTAATRTATWTTKSLSSSGGLSLDPVQFKPASGDDQWSASGVWSSSDAVAPLTDALVVALLNGKVSVSITTPDHSQGILTAPLVPGATDPSNGTPFTAAFTGTGTAAGTFNLNTGKSGLSYSLTVSGVGANAGAQFVAGDVTRDLGLTDMSGMGTLTLPCKNSWVRHLSAYVQYFDSAGNSLVPPKWTDQLSGAVRDAFQRSSTKKFLKMVPPELMVAGIPVHTITTPLDIPVWDEVSTVRVFWGGLGRGSYDSDACPLGIAITAFAEMALPVMILTLGTSIMESEAVVSLLQDPDVFNIVCIVAVPLVAGASVSVIASAQDPAAAAEQVGAALGPLIVKLGAKSALGKWFAEKAVEGAAKRSVPFIDLAFFVLDAAITAASLIQTTVEVLQSPFTYTTDIVATIDVHVELIPDKTVNKFPDYHDHFRVILVYDTGAKIPVTEYPTPTTLSDPIHVTFTGAPAGGRVQVVAAFYAENDWVAGQGHSGWITAVGTDGVLNVTGVEIKVNPIPLSADSVYIHQEKIGLLPDNTLGWLAAVNDPPTDTAASPPPFADQGKTITKWCGITTTQGPEMTAYAYEATGLNLPLDSPQGQVTNSAMFTVQNISVLEHPQRQGYANPGVGFGAPTAAGYHMASPDDGSGWNFFVDPTHGPFDSTTAPAGGYHLRRVALAHDGGPPDMSTGGPTSWGRFPMLIDRIVVHPQGTVFGINFSTHKIFIVTLPAQAVPLATAPMATLASGEGFRDGLIRDPVGIAVALDGRLLILERGNNRVQAFDVNGTPVPYFHDPAGSENKLCTMALHSPDSATLLDISVESQGYVYILYYDGDNDDPANYAVDIYKPDGTFLLQTPGVAAANIVVNVLRDLYTLNYETIVDAGGRVQPSVSMWLPKPPNPSQERR